MRGRYTPEAMVLAGLLAASLTPRYKPEPLPVTPESDLETQLLRAEAALSAATTGTARRKIRRQINALRRELSATTQTED